MTPVGMLDERLGKLHFWLLFPAFQLTFLVQHWLGEEGMPRRCADYLPADGFILLHALSSVGAFLLGVSTLPFLYNVWRTARYGRTLTMEDALPRVRSEYPAFDLRHPAVARRRQLRRGEKTR
ncbi:cbb3-type cytochrome c oxidase subunit I [Streptomyces sp. TRM70350]|nr:cbb3-type cytochrome c oxidase subunit I [Streptomyces sp. TRM70350]